MQVRDRLQSAFEARFGPDRTRERLIFQPTVCRATQDRQTAAVELCKTPCDVAFVVGGVGSSNSRHLYELAQRYTRAYFIEDADDLLSDRVIRRYDFARDAHVEEPDYLPRKDKPTLGVLAGASSPEIVVGRVMERLATFLD
jgi:4-hydroxy-3-methylbut-2-enyl diphosphate reductase IspH